MRLKYFTHFYSSTIGKKTTLTLLGICCLFAPLHIAVIVLPVFIEKFIDDIQNGVFSLAYPKLLFFYTLLFFLCECCLPIYMQKTLCSKE